MSDRIAEVLNLVLSVFSDLSEKAIGKLRLLFANNEHLSVVGNLDDVENAHNNVEGYIPLKDDREKDLSIILKVVRHDKAIIGYAVVPAKGTRSLEAIKTFASLYLSRRVTAKGGVNAYIATQACRQIDCDLTNSVRQREANKATAMKKYAAYIAYSDEQWSVACGILADLPDGDNLIDAIEEMRAESRA